jgi:hypothetical protein
MTTYIDTSALAKWYLNEPFSDEFEAFIQSHAMADISRLTVVEFRCLIARRRRAGDFGKAIESRVFAAFERDIGNGFLRVHPIADQYFVVALGLIDQLVRLPLRTLDAVHLAIAKGLELERVATADRIMANAARALGLDVVRFY